MRQRILFIFGSFVILFVYAFVCLSFFDLHSNSTPTALAGDRGICSVSPMDDNTQYSRFNSNIFTIPICTTDSYISNGASTSSHLVHSSLSFLSVRFYIFSNPAIPPFFSKPYNSFGMATYGGFLDFTDIGLDGNLDVATPNFSTMTSFYNNTSHSFSSNISRDPSISYPNNNVFLYGDNQVYRTPVRCFTNFSGLINPNISKVVISWLDDYYTSTNLEGMPGYVYDGLSFRFYFTDDYYVEYVFYYQSGYRDYYKKFAPLRTIYLLPDWSDSEIYQNGFSDGQQTGYAAGETAGYNSGFSAGKDVGITQGYNAGVNDANTYSFINLIGAVVDAPVSAFVNLLNFDVFGFNMLNLITGLFTLAIIIYIVRIVLGKG